MSEHNETADKQGLYEVGFHIASSISAEEVPGIATKVTDSVVKNGGTFVSSEEPKLRGLAYPLGKAKKGGKDFFDTAYFGHVYFRAEKETIQTIISAIGSLGEVLRFLVVEIPEEALTPRRSERRVRPEGESEGAGVEEGKVKKQLTPEELDKTIDQLVVE
ncbi:MAG: 30S ribosomal protein S6 [Patescibacteria group bacterium]